MSAILAYIMMPPRELTIPFIFIIQPDLNHLILRHCAYACLDAFLIKVLHFFAKVRPIGMHLLEVFLDAIHVSEKLDSMLDRPGIRTTRKITKLQPFITRSYKMEDRMWAFMSWEKR